MLKSAADIIKTARKNPDGFANTIESLSVDELRQLIDKADIAYYRPGVQPILTDAEYDLLRPALKELAPDDPRIARVGSPYSETELRTKVKHAIPMGSLDNTDDGILGFLPWYQSVQEQVVANTLVEQRKHYTVPIMASLKVDGGSILADYVNGVLTRVATRGNGEVGENITANAASFHGLPTMLPKPVSMSVRGEAILYKSDFQIICEREHGIPFDQIDTKAISNPRNVGNGILGRDDGMDCDKIHFIVFNVEFWDGHEGLEFDTEQAKFDTLKDLGFKPVPHKLCSTVDELNDFYNSVANGRDDLPFEIDGVVVCLNRIYDQKIFVTDDIKTRLRPKYARAIKFPHKSNTTVIKEVLLTVGHTGSIIPTAVFEEVRIGGVNVTHALLNNWDEIERLGIAVGDEVEVVLAGDIIPKVIRLVSKGSSRQPIAEPSRCPSCGEPTTRNYRGKKGAVTYCANPRNCSAAKFAKISHWVGGSKKGVGILGIGDTILKALWDNGIINDPSDLYTLTVEQIQDVVLDGGVRIGTSRATEIVKNIQGKKKLALHTFLGSLGIDLLGRRRVQLLRKEANGQLDRLEDWLDDNKLATIQIPGLGDTIRDAIRAGIDEYRPMIQEMVRKGVTIDGESSEPATTEIAGEAKEEPGKPLVGVSCCWTGTRAYIDEFEAQGGTVKSGISKGLHLLVQKDATSTSNKTMKAESLGVRIISVEALKKLLDGELTITDLGIVLQG